MVELARVLALCSTLVMRRNSTLNTHPNVPQVTTDSPDDVLNLVFAPDCVNVVVDSSDFPQTVRALSRIRLKGNLILIGPNSKIEHIVKTPPFNIFKQTNGNYHLISTPFNAFGKSKSRNVRVSFLFIPFCDVCNHGFGEGPMDGEVPRIMQKRRNLNIIWKPAKSPQGVLRMVSSNEADLTMFKPTFEWQRYNMGLDMSPALADRQIRFVMPRSPVPIESIYTFGNAFSSFVWISLAVTMTMCWLSLHLIQMYQNKEWLPQFKDAAICTSSMLSEALPSNWLRARHVQLVRTSIGIWLLGQTVVLFSFRSNLLSSLVRIQYKKQPDTFQDLLDMNMALFLTSDHFMAKMFETSPLPVHQRVRQDCYIKRGGQLETKSWPPDYNLPEDGQTVSLVYSDSMPMYDHLKMGKESLYTSMAGYFYSLKFPLQNELNMALLALKETGIIAKEDVISMKRLVQSSRGGQVQYDKKEKNDVVILTIEHLLLSVVILSACLLVATLTFMLEKITNLARTKPRRKLIVIKVETFKNPEI